MLDINILITYNSKSDLEFKLHLADNNWRNTQEAEEAPLLRE